MTPLCEKCQGKGAYGVTIPAESFPTANGDTIVAGPGYSTVLCDCRRSLEPREGEAKWWSTEQIYAADVTIPIFQEQVNITVNAEVPVSTENFRVQRRGNRYYPTLIDVETPKSLTLHSNTARDLGRALIAAADAADKVDDADLDSCGHWAPCDCAEVIR